MNRFGQEHWDPDAARRPGDTRRVKIESIGDQGDGIARINNSYVVIVPDTDVGERVEIEIDSATASVGFAEVTERTSYDA